MAGWARQSQKRVSETDTVFFQRLKVVKVISTLNQQPGRNSAYKYNIRPLGHWSDFPKNLAFKIVLSDILNRRLRSKIIFLDRSLRFNWLNVHIIPMNFTVRAGTAVRSAFFIWQYFIKILYLVQIVSFRVIIY